MAVIGDIGKTENIEVIQRGVKANTAITKGDICSFDANGYVRLALTTDWADVGFAVAIETAASTAGDGGINVRLAVGNTWVYILAGGVIKPGNLVKFGSGVTGDTEVLAHTFAADVSATVSNVDANNAKYAFALAIGRYIAHENEEANATDAADEDTILVRLGH